VYDDLAAIYDRFIDWPTRLARELPLLEAWLGGARRVADAACGTGGHALALARAGRTVVGFDPSEPALARARRSAERLPARFVTAGFGAMALAGEPPFEAVYCLGNSLPHLTTRTALRAAASDFRRLLVPGGRLLLAMRNLPRAVATRERWLPVRAHRDADGTQWVFQRHYAHRPRGLIDFHFVVLWQAPGAAWRQEVHTTRLRAWSADDLADALAEWTEVRVWSDLAGAPFDPERSADLVVSARC